MRRTLPYVLLLICAAAEAQKTGSVTLKSLIVAGPVVGGEATFARVELTAAATQRVVISFVSREHFAIADVIIPAGQTFVAFALKMEPVASQKTVTLTARTPGSPDVQTTVTVIPPALSGVDCEPKSLPGGSHATCKAWLNGVVASGATPQLQLSSSNGQVAYPTEAKVTVPVGNRSVSFDVTTAGLPQSAKATISAAYAGVTKSSDLTVTPAAIQSFGCAAASPINPQNAGHGQCEIFGGDYGHIPQGGDYDHVQHIEVGFVVHLTAKAPNGGYKIPLAFDVGPPWAGIPETLVVTASKDAGVYLFTTKPVESQLKLKVTAKDPITHNSYPTELIIDPPRIAQVRFDQPSYPSIPLGGSDVTVRVIYETPAPPHGLAFDVTYAGTTDIKGPARVRIAPPYWSSTDCYFTVKIFPCAVNPPCHVSVTLGGHTATATVNP